MKRKFKIMHHQIEQLKEEIQAKDQAYVKERVEHTRSDKEKETLKNELMRLKKVVATAETTYLLVSNQTNVDLLCPPQSMCYVASAASRTTNPRSTNSTTSSPRPMPSAFANSANMMWSLTSVTSLGRRSRPRAPSLLHPCVHFHPSRARAMCHPPVVSCVGSSMADHGCFPLEMSPRLS